MSLADIIDATASIERDAMRMEIGGLKQSLQSVLWKYNTELLKVERLTKENRRLKETIEALAISAKQECGWCENCDYPILVEGGCEVPDLCEGCQ